jgi:hypothetical protein
VIPASLTLRASVAISIVTPSTLTSRAPETFCTKPSPATSAAILAAVTASSANLAVVTLALRILTVVTALSANLAVTTPPSFN